MCWQLQFNVQDQRDGEANLVWRVTINGYYNNCTTDTTIFINELLSASIGSLQSIESVKTV